MNSSVHPSVDRHGRWHPFASVSHHRDPSVASSQFSVVPESVRRVKAAAENVLSRLEEGGTWDAHAEAHRLHELVRDIAAADLRAAGVPRAQLAAFETRASSVADLAARGVGEATAQVANQLLRVIAELYASLGDPVCGELLMLEHLEREIELRSRAGHAKAVDRAVEELRAAWRPMRERIIAVGAGDLAAESRVPQLTDGLGLRGW